MTPKGSRHQLFEFTVLLEDPSFSPFSTCALSFLRGRSFFPFVASPPPRLCLCRPWYYGRRIRELRYIPKVVTRSVFSARVAPRQSGATTLSTIWHKSTRCSTLGEIRPPLSPYCLPSSLFPFSTRSWWGGEGIGPLSGPICRLLIQLAFPPFASAPCVRTVSCSSLPRFPYLPSFPSSSFLLSFLLFFSVRGFLRNYHRSRNSTIRGIGPIVDEIL